MVLPGNATNVLATLTYKISSRGVHYSFTLVWNEYLIKAGGVLVSGLPLILYFVAQRYIVAGLSAGAVTGQAPLCGGCLPPCSGGRTNGSSGRFFR